jgi:hypothetical protein
MTEEFKEGHWVQLSEEGLRHYRGKPRWNEALRAAYIGKSKKYPELIEVIVRGEKMKREVHPKHWKPAP